VRAPGSFDPVEFLDYLVEKWIVFAVACSVAVVLALIVSFTLPKRYTAKATILIEAPAGSDPRAATAISQVYLESLKTYESFASSDTLFLQALDRLHLRDKNGTASVESLKSNVLKVSRPTNTTILEIAATLNDPRKAQELVKYLAEQTVALSKSIESKSVGEIIADYRSQADAALDRSTKAEQAQDSFAGSNPIEGLENEVRNGSEFQYRLENDLALAQTDLADYMARQPAVQTTSENSEDAEWLRRQVASVRSRIAAITTQRRELTVRIAREASQLEGRKSRRYALDEEARSARSAYDEMLKKFNDAVSFSRARTERLHIIDPGIVPQRPSSPNPRLNAIAAFLAALVASFGYLILRFSYIRLSRDRSERAFSLQ
jgi:uncharacterized protein involved in exopolysaccharide biosynthesis